MSKLNQREAVGVSNSEKLTRLIALLGSDKDGEVIAAARAIGRLLASKQQDWHDLAKLLTQQPVNEQAERRYERARSWKPDGAFFVSELEDMLDAPTLTDWEVGFLESLIERASGSGFFAPSDKQAAVLNRIKQKAQAYS